MFLKIFPQMSKFREFINGEEWRMVLKQTILKKKKNLREEIHAHYRNEKICRKVYKIKSPKYHDLEVKHR